MFVFCVLSLVLLVVLLLVLVCEGGCCSDVGDGWLQLDVLLCLCGLYYDLIWFGIGGGEDGYGLLWVLVLVIYVEDSWQVKLQLGVYVENGKVGGLGCIDCGVLDVQQVYWCWQCGGFYVQFGWQEVGYGSLWLLLVCDGLNICLVFDGVCLGWKGWFGMFDLMVLWLVENWLGVFDDWGEYGVYLWGVYVIVVCGQGVG